MEKDFNMQKMLEINEYNWTNWKGPNPFLLPEILEVFFQLKELSVNDFKSFRLVSKDWNRVATKIMIENGIGKIVIPNKDKIHIFFQVFGSDQTVPCSALELKNYAYAETMFSKIVERFKPNLETLILNSGIKQKVDISCFFSKDEENFGILDSFIEVMNQILKHCPNLEKFVLRSWIFPSDNFDLSSELKEFGTNLKITSFTATNCSMNRFFRSNFLSNLFQSQNLKSIDLSGSSIEIPQPQRRLLLPQRLGELPPMLHERGGVLQPIPPSALPFKIETSQMKNVSTLKIGILDPELIKRFNKIDLKLLHFHTDQALRVVGKDWKAFLSNHSQLRSLTVVKFVGDSDKRNMRLQYSGLSLLSELRNLHIPHGGPRHLCSITLMRSCPSLVYLKLGYLPRTMTESIPGFLTYENVKSLAVEVQKSIDTNTLLSLPNTFHSLTHLHIMVRDKTSIEKDDGDEALKRFISNLFPNVKHIIFRPYNFEEIILRMSNPGFAEILVGCSE